MCIPNGKNAYLPRLVMSALGQMQTLLSKIFLTFGGTSAGSTGKLVFGGLWDEGTAYSHLSNGSLKSFSV